MANQGLGAAGASDGEGVRYQNIFKFQFFQKYAPVFHWCEQQKSIANANQLIIRYKREIVKSKIQIIKNKPA